jgi:hypothetical protein
VSLEKLVCHECGGVLQAVHRRAQEFITRKNALRKLFQALLSRCGIPVSEIFERQTACIVRHGLHELAG